MFVYFFCNGVFEKQSVGQVIRKKGDVFDKRRYFSKMSKRIFQILSTSCSLMKRTKRGNVILAHYFCVAKFPKYISCES